MKYELKGTKTGIAKFDRKKYVLKSFVIRFGTIMISLSMLYGLRVINQNRIEDEKINLVVASTDSSNNYTDELNSLLNMDIDDEYKNDLDELCTYLNLIQKYKTIDDEAEKYTIRNKMLDDYKNIESKSLNMLKRKVADDNDISKDDVEIYVGRKGTYAIINDKHVDLKNDDLRLAQSISAFQGYNINGLRQDKDSKSFDKYMNEAEHVLDDSVKLVDSKDSYKLPSSIGYAR